MKNILTTFVSLSISLVLPFAAFAAQPSVSSENGSEINDNIENLVSNIDNPTSAFLMLDNEAENEIVDLGLQSAGQSAMVEDIIAYATKHLGAPYRSGGKGPRGFDCSGFTSYVFKNFDINLSPSSRDQYLQGERVSKSDIRPGDLLFFAGSRGGKTVGHVGLAVDVDDNGNIRFIHASHRGGIRHDSFPDAGYYSRRFLGARRVL